MKRTITPAGTSDLDDLDHDPAFLAEAKLAIRITISIDVGLAERHAAALTPNSQPKLTLMTRRKLDDINRVGIGGKRLTYRRTDNLAA